MSGWTGLEPQCAGCTVWALSDQVSGSRGPSSTYPLLPTSSWARCPDIETLWFEPPLTHPDLTPVSLPFPSAPGRWGPVVSLLTSSPRTEGQEPAQRVTLGSRGEGGFWFLL